MIYIYSVKNVEVFRQMTFEGDLKCNHIQPSGRVAYAIRRIPTGIRLNSAANPQLR